MEMNASERIEASREEVFASLNDPEILKQSIPGCKELEKVSDTEFDAIVGLKVGPIKATFKSKVFLSELDPPNGFTISGEGKGGVAGFAKGGAEVRLESDGDDATILHYDVRVDVGGKLAQLGARLITSTATKYANGFFENFSRIVGGEEEDEASSDEVTDEAVKETN